MAGIHSQRRASPNPRYHIRGSIPIYEAGWSHKEGSGLEPARILKGSRGLRRITHSSVATTQVYSGSWHSLNNSRGWTPLRSEKERFHKLQRNGTCLWNRYSLNKKTDPSHPSRQKSSS